MELHSQLKEMRDLWKKSRDRHCYSKKIHSAYDGQWRGKNDVSILLQAIKLRFPKTWKEIYQYIIDPSINVLPWAVNLLSAIYSGAPTRTISDLPITTYDTATTNMCMGKVAALTVALREVFVRPMVGKRGLSFDIIPPHKTIVLPDPLDPMGFSAIAYETSDKKLVFWSDEHHFVFVDNGFDLARPDPNDPANETGTNPYGRIPIVCFRPSYPVGEWWHHKDSDRLYRAALETIIAITQIRRTMQAASAKRPWLKGKAGKDFGAQDIIDVAFPLILSKDGEAGSLDLTTDIVAQIEGALTPAIVALNQEGITPQMVRGSSGEASSGYRKRLEMTGLEERRDDLRVMFREGEQELVDVSRIVVEVERKRPRNKGLEPIPEGEFSIKFASTAPDATPPEQQEYWTGRLQNGTATRAQAIADMDKITLEEAEQVVKKIDEDKAASARGSMFGLDEASGFGGKSKPGAPGGEGDTGEGDS